MTVRVRSVSRHCPKGWTRVPLPFVGEEAANAFLKLTEPKIGKGAIIKAVLWYDEAGDGRWVDLLFENGVLLNFRVDNASDCETTEHMPLFEMRIGGPEAKAPAL
jgi:hypothetical protein